MGFRPIHWTPAQKVRPIPVGVVLQHHPSWSCQALWPESPLRHSSSTSSSFGLLPSQLDIPRILAILWFRRNLHRCLRLCRTSWRCWRRGGIRWIRNRCSSLDYAYQFWSGASPPGSQSSRATFSVRHRWTWKKEITTSLCFASKWIRGTRTSRMFQWNSIISGVSMTRNLLVWFVVYGQLPGH